MGGAGNGGWRRAGAALPGGRMRRAAGGLADPPIQGSYSRAAGRYVASREDGLGFPHPSHVFVRKSNGEEHDRPDNSRKPGQQSVRDLLEPRGGFSRGPQRAATHVAERIQGAEESGCEFAIRAGAQG